MQKVAPEGCLSDSRFTDNREFPGAALDVASREKFLGRCDFVVPSGDLGSVRFAGHCNIVHVFPQRKIHRSTRAAGPLVSRSILVSERLARSPSSPLSPRDSPAASASRRGF